VTDGFTDIVGCVVADDGGEVVCAAAVPASANVKTRQRRTVLIA
jgi:hypothetical protein